MLDPARSKIVSSADFLKIVQELPFAEEIAKGLSNKVRGNPTLHEIKGLLPLLDKLLFDEFSTNKITFTQAKLRALARYNSNCKEIICLDDLIDSAGKEMFNISAEKANDLNTIMSKIFRKDTKYDMYNGKVFHFS